MTYLIGQIKRVESNSMLKFVYRIGSLLWFSNYSLIKVKLCLWNTNFYLQSSIITFFLSLVCEDITSKNKMDFKRQPNTEKIISWLKRKDYSDNGKCLACWVNKLLVGHYLNFFSPSSSKAEKKLLLTHFLPISI